MEIFSPGSFCGKNIVVTETRKITEKECQKFFAQFNFLELARKICKLSLKLFLSEKIENFGGVPFNDRTLCDALSLSIKYANNEKLVAPSEEGLKEVVRIALREEEQELLKHSDALEMMTRIAYDQFHESPIHVLSRAWCLFTDAWPSSNTIKPLEEIEMTVGLSYKSVLYFTLASFADGYVFPYKQLSELSSFFGEYLKENAHQQFLNYFSSTKADWLKKTIPPIYVSKPILNSGEVPDGKESVVYFVPSVNYLLARVTTGIYHDISDRYSRGAGENLFRVEFGYAFEKYVGMLLEFYLKSFEISKEIVYGKQQKKTVDYFLKKDKELVLVEVKQSGIFANAKYLGDHHCALNDLKKNVGKAIKQIRTTQNLIKNGQAELSAYKECSVVHNLIVVNDRLYNANSICKDLLKPEHGDLSDISFINISELESLLEIQDENQDLLEILKNKVEHFPSYDFNELWAHEYKERTDGARFLRKYYGQIFPERGT